MATMRIKIEGEERVRAALRAGDARVKAALTEIVLAAGEVIRAQAENNVRSISNRVAEAMSKEVVDKRPTRVEVHVGPGKKRAWYAHIIERGAKAHGIDPRRKKFLRFIDGSLHKHANHPGVRPRPFMRPAFDNKKDDAKQQIAQGIRRVVR